MKMKTNNNKYYIILYYITGFLKLKLVGIKQMNDLQINTKLGCFKSHESQ